MKTRIASFLLGILCLVFAVQLWAGHRDTYQGRLNDGRAPANGSYDLRIGLFAGGSGGSAVAGPLDHSSVHQHQQL